MRIQRHALICSVSALALLALGACDSDDGGNGVPGDTVSDTTTGDVTPDEGPQPDTDGDADVEPDMVEDVQPDAVQDVEPDAVQDVEPDAVQDVEPDADQDVEPDADQDVQVDVPDGGCTNDEQCVVADPCMQGSCNLDTGDCEFVDVCVEGDSHPCVASETPGSNDADVTACVCALDDYCCSTAWDGTCVGVAVDSCALNCDCSVAEPAELACEGPEDCDWCGGDACTGAWDCVEGACVQGAPLECTDADPDDCLVPECVPTTPEGECSEVPDSDLCDDGNPCTADTCDVDGVCANEPIEGCGTNNPCHESGFPTSADEAVTACVCALDETCCGEAWTTACTELAASDCGAVCDCSAGGVACATDADCIGCDGNDDLCDGTWTCGAGNTCEEVAAVECTGDVATCLLDTCDPATGECSLVPTEEACDDADACTLDACNADTGACTNEDMCGLNHPCQESDFPESSDPAITACTCEADPFCCDTLWDSFCVETAQTECGLVCDCAVPDEPVACESDADCGWCSQGDLCAGEFTCVDGFCGGNTPVVCDDTNDLECIKNTCDPGTGECAMTPDPELCDDDDACTVDLCGPDSGTCSHAETSPDCSGTPSYECQGTEVPAVEGSCADVAALEGCCDAWGRTVWCQDGDTYCIDCAGINPLCGWNAEGPFYDCGTDGSADPSGTFPKMCSEAP